MEQDLEGAAALIEEYEAETGKQVTFNYGHTPTRINDQVAELLLGWWNEIGVDATDAAVPQDQFITQALFGDPKFQRSGWRNHAGVGVDQQYFWWHSAGSHPDGELSLNFGRVDDPMIDAALDTRPLGDRRGRGAGGCRRGQPADRRGVLPHPAVVDAVGDRSASRTSRASARSSCPTARRPVTAPGSPAQFWTHALFVDE